MLFPALLKDGYRERFALGLLTASGSLGLLLPPSLPLMLYGVVAQIPIEDLFIGGMLPGMLLTAMMAAWGMREGVVSGAGRQAFAWREARQALAAAKWELALPLVVLVALFSGVATAVEAAALTAAYALVVQSVVHRDLSIRRDVIRVFAECVGLVGGVLVILGVAVGLTSWMVGAQVPMRLVEFTRDHIASQFMFLLALNAFLVLVGCLMEIFPAIVVVVPLIVPLGVAFNVHPVHLGHHLHRQSRTRIPDAAGRTEYPARVLPFQAAGAGSGARVAADGGYPRSRCSRHYLRSVADARVAPMAGPRLTGSWGAGLRPGGMGPSRHLQPPVPSPSPEPKPRTPNPQRDLCP